jgi:protein-tyrosine phosphatase
MDSNSTITHESVIPKIKSIEERVNEELDKGQPGLWLSLPPVEIYPGLWLGNMFNAQDMHFRTTNNIKTIVNCATYEAQVQLINIQTYVCLNASDDDNYRIIDNHFSYVYEMIDISIEKGWNVMIHCQCGINRSATLAIAYLCNKFQCPIERAILNVFQKRPCILSNRGFRKQLFEWAHSQYWINKFDFQSVSLLEIDTDDENSEPQKGTYKLVVNQNDSKT